MFVVIFNEYEELSITTTTTATTAPSLADTTATVYRFFLFLDVSSIGSNRMRGYIKTRQHCN